MLQAQTLAPSKILANTLHWVSAVGSHSGPNGLRPSQRRERRQILVVVNTWVNQGNCDYLQKYWKWKNNISTLAKKIVSRYLARRHLLDHNNFLAFLTPAVYFFYQCAIPDDLGYCDPTNEIRLQPRRFLVNELQGEKPVFWVQRPFVATRSRPERVREPASPLWRRAAIQSSAVLFPNFILMCFKLFRGKRVVAPSLLLATYNRGVNNKPKEKGGMGESKPAAAIL